ncbi:MAG: antibiotic biosynthesis monooxygenase [Nevskia sp.]|nr:antibiotic biosynthesis monooxygenase [Nevskia sp.]
MIIVTGSVLAREGCAGRLLALGLEHAASSRKASGCLNYVVFRDAENPLRLVFMEQWADRATLIARFAAPASREFVRAAAELAEGAPRIRMYEAQEIQLQPGGA